MTENEAKEVLQNFDMQVSAKADGAYQSTIGEMACKVAVSALEELQQYRSIGTVSECREAVKKQRAKEREIESYCGFEDFICPSCRMYLHCESQYCHKCGQKLK